MTRRREVELLRAGRVWPLVDLASPLGLRIVRARVSSRLFLLAADRAPRLAAWWAALPRALRHPRRHG